MYFLFFMTGRPSRRLCILLPIKSHRDCQLDHTKHTSYNYMLFIIVSVVVNVMHEYGSCSHLLVTIPVGWSTS